MVIHGHLNGLQNILISIVSGLPEFHLLIASFYYYWLMNPTVSKQPHFLSSCTHTYSKYVDNIQDKKTAGFVFGLKKM